MDKRYQVFVSSTYADLEEERHQVMQTLMEMDCIPAGMEIFPAADEEQWEFIKKVIDDCDYYLLIIGGRYGSLTSEGISYTEKEFDYAVEKNIKVVALICVDPDELPGKNIDKEPDLIAKLVKFKEKVKKDRLVKFWKKGSELRGLVALSLQKTMKMYPAIGWVRGDQTASSEILSEINELRKEKERLEKIIEENNFQMHASIAGLDSVYKTPIFIEEDQYEVIWKELYFYLGLEIILDDVDSIGIRGLLKKYFSEVFPIDEISNEIIQEVFNKTKIQFLALDLIVLHNRQGSTYQSKDLFGHPVTSTPEFEMWQLSEKGKRIILNHHAQKKEE